METQLDKQVGYDQWLTPDRIILEERAWEYMQYHRFYVEKLVDLLDGKRLWTVNEFGCGTGLVPSLLSPTYRYTGYDNNFYCLNVARTRNPGRHFEQLNLLNYQAPYADVGCAFAFLKHFTPTDLPKVLLNLMHNSGACLFTFTENAGEDNWFSDPGEFIHTRVSKSWITGLINGSKKHEVAGMGPTPWPGEFWVQTEAV